MKIALHTERFSSDVKTMCKSMSINPFTQDKLVTLNCAQAIPDIAITTLRNMEEIGENQVVRFFSGSIGLF